MYIHQFTVKNYRSLKNVSVGDLSKAVILYGENDTGKSNILSFLEIVFQPKYSEQITEAPNETFVRKESSGFWQGQIENFSNNFYLNDRKPITFSILIKFERSELLNIHNLSKKFVDKLPKNHAYDVLLIEGQISSLTDDTAEMKLTNAKFNQASFYDGTQENPEFLPAKAFDDLSLTEKRDIFDGVMNSLDNAFLRIPPDRFLSQEEEMPRDEKAQLTAKTLKNWLFQTSHDQHSEKIIRAINEQFNNKPFNHGNLSLVRAGKNEIEAFVEGKYGLKLPIGRRGSGVQQILMILSYIAQANAPIIGIEELEINLSPQAQRDLVTNLLDLLNSKSSVVRQIILTTHSPHIGKRNEAQRRGVSIEKGETKVKKPSEADIKDFFRN